MQWLIVEDALRNKVGHWLEYVSTFRDGLVELGDSVLILCDRQAGAWLVDEFEAEPVLPPSIWAKMSDGSPKWKRLLRIPVHGWRTWFAVRRRLGGNAVPDVIFVPTVLVHHLLGWWRLIEGPLKKSPSKILLFFPNSPIYLDGQGIAHLNPDPSAKLFRWLIRKLDHHVQTGKVVLGAETEPMVAALTAVTGVPFTYLPHPVQLKDEYISKPEPTSTSSPLLGAYGAARHEKGSDLLQAAIRNYLEENPDAKERFTIQWLGDFEDDRGQLISKDIWLQQHPNFEFITSYFQEGGYMAQVARTDVMLLPYRENYALRVSRVVIEAMILGIPAIATRGTTLHQQASNYGVVISCEPDSIESLTEAIETAVNDLDQLKLSASARAESAREHFSVKTFRQRLLATCQTQHG